MLRCAAILVQSTYEKVRLIPRLLRALHLDIFEQPARNRVFQQSRRPFKKGIPAPRLPSYCGTNAQSVAMA